MKRNITKVALKLSALGLSCAICVPALAQDASAVDAQEARAVDDGDIVVTARKVGENVQSLPIAITALGGEDIEAKVIQNANDLGKLVPSLTTFQQSTGAAGLYFQIRGLVQTDTAAYQAGSVGIYSDDVYIGGAMVAGQLLNTNDLERIEVLKGPQGTLYGRNVTGGVVKFVTAKPKDEFEAYAKLGVGNYQRRLIEGMVNAPLGEGIAVRLNGQIDERGGYSHDVRNDRDLDDSNKWTVRGALKFDPAPDLSILVQGWYGKYHGNGADTRAIYVDPTNASNLMNFIVATGIDNLTAGSFAPLIFGGTPENVAAAGAALAAAAPKAFALLEDYRNRPRDQAQQDPRFRTFDRGKLGGGALTLAYDPSDSISLKSITAYSYAGRQSGYAVGGDLGLAIYGRQRGSVSQWTQELQATGNAFDDRLKYAAGIYYLDQQIGDDRNPSSMDGPFPYLFGQFGLGLTNETNAINRIKIRSIAPYGQASFEIVPSVNVTAGLRYTDEKFSIESSAIEGPTLVNGSRETCVAPAPSTNATPVDQCLATGSVKFTNWSYAAGLDWTVAPSVLLYVRTGKGFKAGGLNAFSPAYTPILPFQPESNTDYEVGFKSTLFDRLLRLNLAYFHTKYNDIQRTVVTLDNGRTLTQIQNAASAKIDGAEAEVRLSPVVGFTVGGTLTYTDARYDDYVVANPNFPGGQQDLSYLPFSGLPKWLYTLSADYRGETAWGGYRASVDWSHRSSSYLSSSDIPSSPTAATAPLSTLTQEGYGLLGASLSFDIAKYNASVQLWGKNILGKEYFEGSSSLVGLGIGSQYGNFGAPATYGVDVTFRF